jgi:hypothetical protein
MSSAASMSSAPNMTTDRRRLDEGYTILHQCSMFNPWLASKNQEPCDIKEIQGRIGALKRDGLRDFTSFLNKQKRKEAKERKLREAEEASEEASEGETISRAINEAAQGKTRSSFSSHLSQQHR